MIFNRPWVLIVLILGLLVFTLASFVQFGMALSLWTFLSSLPVAVTPVYQAAAGLTWGCLGAIVIVWLWKGKSRGKIAARILSVTYGLYYWIDELFLAESEIRSSNWLFSGLMTVLLVLLVFGSLALPSVSRFLGEEHEQEK